MNKYFIKFGSIIFIFIIVILHQSCVKNKNNTETNAIPADKVVKEYLALKDSTNKTWKEMMTSDDEKITNIGRLLQEISYAGKYNVFLFDSVSKAQKVLVEQRYTQESIANSATIDNYDNATDALIKQALRLAQTTPNIEKYQTAMQLINDIMEADNQVVFYRVRYDRFANAQNTFIEKHSKKLEQQTNVVGDVKKLPLFTIQPKKKKQKNK